MEQNGPQSPTHYRVGVDIGGTFTDFTVVDANGDVTLWKQDSTPAKPEEAIEIGLSAVADQLGLELPDFLGRTRLFVHGSTIATNTVIQRSGPRIGLVCTEGLRDILYFRDAYKPERFNIHLPHPREFVDRYLRLGVDERIGARGEVVRPLDESDVRSVAGALREAGVEAVAVAFLWSIVNRDHEDRAAELLAEELPGVHVIKSVDVLPEIREWERTSATVLSAYVLPGISRYLRRLEGLLADRGLERAPLIMQINGGCASVDEVLERPVFSLASGPAAAPSAAAFAARGIDEDNLIAVDMGGTSFDVCVVRDGRAQMSRTIQVEDQPIGVAGVEVHSIGAGGGSIAWIDAGNALRVGPQSAGAHPGPVCYDAGGTEPTVTDANVVLGYLDPEAFLGGRRRLADDLSRDAIESRVARPLALDVVEAAAGIVELVEWNMSNAIRAVSVERGVDPRGFVLVSGGGAGGIHAGRLARRLGIGRVLIPSEAGTLCAFGMTVTDVRHDYSTAMHQITSDADPAQIDALFERMESQARDQLRRDGFDDDQIVIERAVDARYPNQVHELTVPIASKSSYSREDIAELERDFHEEHHSRFTYSLAELPVECLHWRVAAIGRMPFEREGGTVPAGESGSLEQATIATRLAYSDGEMVETAVYGAAALKPGAVVEGPAIIQAPTTTVVVNRDDRVTVQGDGGLVMDVAGVASGTDPHGGAVASA